MDLQEVSPRCSFFSSIVNPDGRSSIRERHPLHGYKKSIEQIRFSGYDPPLFLRVIPADPIADNLTPVPKLDSYGLSVNRQSRLNRRPFPLRRVHVQSIKLLDMRVPRVFYRRTLCTVGQYSAIQRRLQKYAKA